jgi:tetratricopeptide (TPR) repeat protein
MGLERELANMGEIRALFGLGRLEDAQRLAEKQISDPDVAPGWKKWFRAYLVGINAASGDTARAEKYLDQLRAAGAAPRFLAWAHAGIGNLDRALDEYSQIDGTGWGHIAVLDGLFSLGGLYKGGLQGASGKPSAIRDDPRYQELLREVYQAWSLDPDGSIPEPSDTTITAGADADS